MPVLAVVPVLIDVPEPLFCATLSSGNEFVQVNSHAIAAAPPQKREEDSEAAAAL